MTTAPENKHSQVSDDLARACDWIGQADALIVTAGAGMGVDSGMPDFRGANGLWRAYPGLGRRQISFREIANPDSFDLHPRLAWGFYGHRLEMYRNITPHEGFDILLEIGNAMPHGYFVFTSNVDGQFQKAGFPQERVHECHGSIHHMQCHKPCSPNVWSSKNFKPVVDLDRTELLNELPRCPYCLGIASPNILMFNDSTWLGARYEAQEEKLNAFVSQCASPVIIELGAGKAVPTVRWYGEGLVKRHNARMIRINTDINVGADPDDRHLHLHMGSLDALKMIRDHQGRVSA